uniref:Uncharacterized protein n=1 Tax=Trichogramma kaykai TaxID=54128 RepID=A0ABD2XB06_9HYME
MFKVWKISLKHLPEDLCLGTWPTCRSIIPSAFRIISANRLINYHINSRDVMMGDTNDATLETQATICYIKYAECTENRLKICLARARACEQHTIALLLKSTRYIRYIQCHFVALCLHTIAEGTKRRRKKITKPIHVSLSRKALRFLSVCTLYTHAQACVGARKSEYVSVRHTSGSSSSRSSS